MASVSSSDSDHHKNDKEIESATQQENQPLLTQQEEKGTADTEDSEEDGGWKGWIVVLVSFFCVATLDGVGYTTGLMLSTLLKDLGGSWAEVCVLGSLQVGVYSLTGPIVGRIITEWGGRPVCMLGAFIAAMGMLGASFAQSLGGVLVGYSVVAGVGFGMMYIPSVVSAAPFFKKRRSLAIGICLCGSGVGTFSLAPVTQTILASYGWRWVCRAFAFLCLGCMVGSIGMFPHHSFKDNKLKEKEEKEEKERKQSISSNQVEKLRAPYRVVDPTLLEHPNFPTFLLVLLADFIAFVGIYIPYTHLPPLVEARGVSSEDAAFLISAAGISATFGRFLGGWLCDLPSIHPVIVTLFSILFTGLPSLALPSATTYGVFFMLFSIFGLAAGCMVGAASPLLLKLLGLKALSQTFGLLTAFRGISALIGPPAAGLLVDYFENLGVPLYMTGILMMTAFLICILAILRNSLATRRRGYTEL